MIPPRALLVPCSSGSRRSISVACVACADDQPAPSFVLATHDAIVLNTSMYWPRPSASRWPPNGRSARYWQRPGA